MTPRRSVYGPGTHVVEFNPDGHDDPRWVQIKGPWPLATCESYVEDYLERLAQTSGEAYAAACERRYRVVEA